MIVFTPDLFTNVAQIDEQHKELFNRINIVASMGDEPLSKEETEKTLDFLGNYIIKHFDDEEKLQRKTGYPKFSWHHEMHKWYIAEFEKLKEEYCQNGPSEQFTLLLNKSIINWIVKHIKTVDMYLANYLNKHQPL